MEAGVGEHCAVAADESMSRDHDAACAGGRTADRSVTPQRTTKGRMLGLPGWRSNRHVLECQVANLGLDRYYDVTYLNGWVPAAGAADELVGAIVEGLRRSHSYWYTEKRVWILICEKSGAPPPEPEARARVP